MTSSGWIRDVTDDTFEADVLEASQERIVVVDFWAPWCQPCQMLGPMLERLVNARQGQIVLARVNADDAPALAHHFRISSIPAVKIFYRGQIVNEFTGLYPEEALEQLFDELAPVADPELQRARAVEQADPAGAEAAYRQLLDRQPDLMEARIGLALVLLRLGRPDEVPTILEPIGSSGELGAESDTLLARAWLVQAARDLPDRATLEQKVAGEPKNAAARLDYGTRLAALEEYPLALQELLTAAELDNKLATGRAREVMVKVFYGLGANHPLSNEYRARLSRLLY